MTSQSRTEMRTKGRIESERVVTNESEQTKAKVVSTNAKAVRTPGIYTRAALCYN
jgi:hypothetical protein